MKLVPNEREGWSITVAADHEAMSALAAGFIIAQIAANPRCVLSLPTGSTPLALFDILAAQDARGDVDFSNVTFFSLDDYLGLQPSDANSLSGWLERAFLNRVAIQPDNIHLVPAAASSPVEAAAAYEAELTRRGGFDLVVLGMGENGHIAFNEPGSGPTSRTRVVDLAPETREQAAAYWDDRYRIPDQAMTIGMANILDARQIVLLVSGAAKAHTLREALTGKTTPRVPASLLRLAGPRLNIFADVAAASGLNPD